ncbi:MULTISPECIES: hydantoinase/oxoprolinase N-terminal domain-containing protein [Heyndrickxia]|uniref:hydantoinase/oxoprolinase N-terminal domain-containing protein n=1 Tax=Heyndrickxia TaxID=2837504 RepID=UPI0007793F1C|nr:MULTISPECIES: hydantoinase/oxoprolinase family protein [Heyndrickxia]KYC77216.1 N-methylhydantoinase (ATP-hydrolyzing) [Heyndrickxia coagulans]MED4344212.1 hydantoinase/oxoprolinase family protein [Heyndrickxia coagulans]MED4839349.1 hydantoinase/oxoprolinase family protein [Weizmannia sp. CD-2023]MED4899997.1 hydantoinase/oxoprolinase family protein [Weizmannia sp. CD-2023]NMH84058.1 hydantoinase/oxoprolinase family protein [Heyndrickxia coagulans]
MGVYRVGIDVGGTHTDAVLLDEKNTVIAETKSPTTEDVATGIYHAMHKIISDANVPRDQIHYAMLGTTHCTNAIVERKRLNHIAVVRIGAPATLAVKPLIGVPEDLREALGKHVYLVRGGHEFDGREITALDTHYLFQIAREVKGKVDSIAITSVFSPVSQDHEHRASEIFREVLGDEVAISLSSEIGSVGLLERENATILNAAVVNVAKTAAEGFIQALENEGIKARVFFGQNDGTLMSVDYAVKYPIFTVACGPTNSLRGASYLSQLSDAIVVDVGGTTSDAGVLVNSFPRESSLAVEIGGARTNFRMPDLISIGLGGGTIVRIRDNGEFTIGPDSVGYRLPEKGLIFGGDTLTTTDVAVALGKVELGDPEKVAHLDKKVMQQVYGRMVEMVEEAIDKMKTSAAPVPVILVGGGSVLLPDSLKGASRVIRPEHSGVANAIGSAIAQVSGQIEKIYVLDEIGREQALESAKSQAKQEAIKAGADPGSLVIVDIEDVPLAYLPGNATRIRVKAAGELGRMSVAAI